MDFGSSLASGLSSGVASGLGSSSAPALARSFADGSSVGVSVGGLTINKKPDILPIAGAFFLGGALVWLLKS